MIALALRSLGQRKLRTALTAIAVLLGVAMIAGTYVQTDRIRGAFESLMRTSNRGTDVVVSPRQAFAASLGAPSQGLDEGLLARVRAVPGVRVAEGQLERHRLARHPWQARLERLCAVDRRLGQPQALRRLPLHRRRPAATGRRRRDRRPDGGGPRPARRTVGGPEHTLGRPGRGDLGHRGVGERQLDRRRHDRRPAARRRPALVPAPGRADADRHRRRPRRRTLAARRRGAPRLCRIRSSSRPAPPMPPSRRTPPTRRSAASSRPPCSRSRAPRCSSAPSSSSTRSRSPSRSGLASSRCCAPWVPRARRSCSRSPSRRSPSASARRCSGCSRGSASPPGSAPCSTPRSTCRRPGSCSPAGRSRSRSQSASGSRCSPRSCPPCGRPACRRSRRSTPTRSPRPRAAAAARPTSPPA